MITFKHVCLFSQGVMNYPRKGKKKAPREEKTAVVILRRDGTNGIEFLLVQRPGTGEIRW